jgi:putative hydrolase of the HAD superfamily
MTLQAVLFDAAGTLVHLREPVGITYARFAADCGVEVDARQLDRAFRTCFRSMQPMVFPNIPHGRIEQREYNWWRELVAGVFSTVEPARRFDDFDAYFDLLFRHFASAEAWRAAPRALETLSALRSLGKKTGIVSNFDLRLHGILAGLGLNSLLDVVVLPADAGAAKPDPRIFALALRRLQVTSQGTLYVGDDAEDDIAGARRAGLTAIDVASLSPLTAVLALVD